MYNNIENEEREAEAITLINQAEILVDKGKGDEALQTYERAAQIYLDIGSYLKLDEIYIRITQVISQFKNNIQATYRLKSIIRKTEELKLYEISAKLLIQLGNISYRMRDWETAGESWSTASEYLLESDPEEFDSLASILLLKAGQSYERSSITKDLGKRLILKAVMKIHKFDDLYQEEEKRSQLLINNNEFKTAAEKFYTISTYFKTSLENLDALLSDADSKDTMLNAKARFIHFVAEYQTVSVICLAVLDNPDYDERIEFLGNDSIKMFQESITLLKEYLLPIKSDFDKEVILRLTFDTMLLLIIQRILNIDDVKGTDYLLSGIETNNALVKQLKKSPYFQIAKKIEKVGLTESLNDLLKTHMGHFEKIKNTLISHYIN